MTPWISDSGAGLELERLTVHYRGHRAVHEVSLMAPLGALTGLIGPNGAGKTTIFNASSGLLRPSGGAVSLFGDDITGVSAAVRARRGLGRTFQRMKLWNSMTVRENIGVGIEAGIAGANPWRQFVSRPSDRCKVNAAVDAALSQCGLEEISDRRAGGLSTGQRRLVELARAYASGFKVLMLDEPSSGLDPVETEKLGEMILAMAEEGVGILLVEHDMSLVMNVCSRIYVLDFGELIFVGTPAEVQSSEIVRAAYLGSSRGLHQATARARSDQCSG